MNQDNISAAVLVFTLLIGGTAAIGSEFTSSSQVRNVATAQQSLPGVVVTGKRAASTAVAAQHAVAEPTQIR